MKLLRLAFLGVLALVLIALALANRDLVTLRALPPEAGDFLGFSWTVQLPMFLVIFAGILLGLLIGFVWEWLREHKIRSHAVKVTRKAATLEREVDRLKAKSEGPKDEVLALLDASSR
ncbi:MAG: LapA family protein [Paracoccaceae bacterium]|nr:LapA family protein [Paracoccaceae bacterium]